MSHACVFNQAAATGGDARQLVGYLVSDSGLPLDTAALKARLAEQLPPHMVPVVLMQLAELPLSANGKLDRKALPLPTLGGERSGRPPEPGMETLVAAAFSQLLGCEVNDIDADFFALGGHSLLAMRLAAQLSRQLARQVTPGQVMVASTVGKLSALLAADLSDEQAQRLGLDTLLPLRESDGPTLFCFHPASGFAWQFSVLARYLSPRWSITGIQSPRPQGPMASAASLDEVCEHHLQTLLAQQPHGPYYLFGYSLGGTLAQGDCRPLAPARRSGGLPRPAGYLAAGDAKLGGERGQRAGSRGTGGDRPRARSVPRRPAGASLRRAVQRYRRQLCRCGAAVNYCPQREV
ncbi:enterobactin synthase subunit F [Klebsiella pneumoniae]|uniref:Enterobactin synthase subunit F n=1 Tax=Klebsiella pneumoniae TaxID=573 RepID=A0A377UZ44_KLEPN|nr:enterobactin synthase subunit F [Klebsiella pneumoniae]